MGIDRFILSCKMAPRTKQDKVGDDGEGVVGRDVQLLRMKLLHCSKWGIVGRMFRKNQQKEQQI